MALRYVVRSAAISGFQAEAGDLATAIMREAGIQPEQLEAADLPMDVSQLQHLLAIASLRLERPDLGLSLARHQDLDMLGLLGKVLRGASTLQEAFTIAQRYMSLQQCGALAAAKLCRSDSYHSGRARKPSTSSYAISRDVTCGIPSTRTADLRTAATPVAWDLRAQSGRLIEAIRPAPKLRRAI
ncbi:AraC family transcriptional regulator ligand-binding domain-containing protein [Halopseudomonas pachastrellae]|nr:AraC family transcriptional regulator ligand-binding domain-containing protein [Halopseudomonas pachastrellae]